MFKWALDSSPIQVLKSTEGGENVVFANIHFLITLKKMYT